MVDLPWGETTNTPARPAQAPEFSIAAANAFIPNLLLSLIGPIFHFVFIVVFQFVAIFWFLSRGRTYVIYPGEYDVNFNDVRGYKATVEATQEIVGEEIDTLFARLEACGEPQGSGVV